MKQQILILALSLIGLQINAQTWDDYFQQEVNYKIDVALNDSTHELSAYEEIQYINNAKVELNFLYFHLWANAYKNNSTALAKQLLEDGETKMYYAKPQDLGYIDSLDFKVNGRNIKWELTSENIDICRLFLETPLKPGDTITISTPFHVKIPSALISRLGHIGQAYMITQWYPKPAVFDENGWNPMPYLNQGEFYSEFGSFDVSITLPKNYLLAATGDRIDETGEEEKFLLERFEETKEKIRRYESGGDYAFLDDMSFPKSSPETKTIRFKQYNVHDFAWFADKRFNVLQGEVNLPKTQRDVKTWAFFTNQNLPLWKNSREYLNDATFFYSLWNGDYQYNHVTAIDGTISAGGGMEYPNITVIGNANDPFELETVIMHEVGHNWFYGMLGSNERKHAWMDEGINSFNELRYIKTKYPSATIGAIMGRDSTFKLLGINRFKQQEQYKLFYDFVAKQNLDQPCELPSEDFTGINYGAIVYSKTAILFNYLMNYMGEDDFDRAMQFYFANYKFKHPQPSDLRKTLEYFSGKDLSWFFDDLLGTTKKLDYKVVSAKKFEETQYIVKIKNVGQIKGPVAVCGLYKGQIRAMIWLDGFEGTRNIIYPPVEVDEFRIDYFQFMPDINRKNNTMRAKGLFRKVEPLRFPLIASLDYPYQTQLNWAPIGGYNQYNGLMAGLAFYNHTVFQKKMEFELAPMYAFNNKTLAGYASVRFNYLAKNVFQQITYGVNASRFAYSDYPFNQNYDKIAPFIDLLLKKKRARSPITQHFTYRAVYIHKEDYNYYFDANTNAFAPEPSSTDYLVNDFTYKFSNKRAIDPFSFNVNFQNVAQMNKASLTANYDININKKKAFKLRLFAGKMFTQTNTTSDFRFRMSGQTGYQDYMYDNIYFARTSSIPNIGAQQFTETDGAFKVYTPLGQSNDWIVSFNVKTPQLYKIPLYLYADAGAYHTSGLSKNIETLYSAGVGIPIAKDFIEVFIPLLNSKNITDVQKLNGTPRFIDTIRFTFYLNKANPFNALKNFMPF